MKWQKVLLVSLPPLVISGGLGLLVHYASQQKKSVPLSEVQLASSVGRAPIATTPLSDKPLPAEDAGGGESTTVIDVQPEESVKKPSDEQCNDGFRCLEEFRIRGLSLSRDPLWVSLVNHPRALWVLVKVTEQLAGGERPLALVELGMMAPLLPFEAVLSGDAWVMSPATEARLTPAVEALHSLAPVKMAELFKVIEPELERVFHEELGYPQEDTFRTSLFQAMEMLLKTPVCESSPRLVRITSRLYRFEAAELESLTHAQKFLLRMGRKNQAEVQGWLRAFWQAL